MRYILYLTPLGIMLKNVYLHGWSVCKSNVWNIACPGVFVVILNKRRATLSGAFSAPTRRAGAIFPPNFVENDLCRTTTSNHFRLVERKNSRQAVVALKDKQTLPYADLFKCSCS